MPKFKKELISENEFHDEDLQDIITKVPPRLITWGLTIALVVLLLMAVVLSYVQYPETISFKTTIRSSKSPLRLTLKNNATIKDILVKEGELVKPGQILVNLKNSDDTQLISTNAGRLTFLKPLYAGKDIDANEALFYLEQMDHHFHAEIQAPQENISLIKKGQKVTVKLNAFPIEKFGKVEGRIDFVGIVPEKNGSFLIDVIFNNNLNDKVKLSDGLNGVAQITIKDVSLINRFFQNIL